MDRPAVSVFIAASLDGFIAGPGGALDWLDQVQREGEDYGYAAFMDTVDAVVMGRNTYDKVATFAEWPFHEKKMVVLTHRPLVSTHGVATYRGSLQPLLSQLSEAGVRRVYLDGGQAIQQGLAEHVVDEITVSWIPVMLGGGVPLFARSGPRSNWGLVSHQAYPAGLVQVTYRRDGQT